MSEKRQIDRSIVDQAKSTSPVMVLRHYYGGDVKETSGGRSISVKKVLRADKKPNGQWVSCQWHGEGIGDNIQLMQYCGALGFEDAVMVLTGQAPYMDKERVNRVANIRPRRSSQFSADNLALSDKHLSMPKFITDNRAGRDYLIGRGISLDTIRLCEEQKILGYTDDGVCFLGRDVSGTLKYIAHRYYKEMPIPDDPGETRNKKDAYGSQKTYCFNVVPRDSDKPFAAYIVEGGINALAVYDICRSRGEENVLIQTTGSVAGDDWMENPITAPLFKKAKTVTMIGEWESEGKRETKEEKQAKTDASRKRVLEQLAEKLGVHARLVYPNRNFGDIADFHKAKGIEAGRIQEVAKIEELEKQPAIERPVRRPPVAIRRVVLPPRPRASPEP